MKLTCSRPGLVLSLAMMSWGCGGDHRKTVCPPISANSGTTCPCNAACPIQVGPTFLYATSASNGGQILGFTVDFATGSLATPTSVPGPQNSQGITSLDHQFLYVSDASGGAVDGFSVIQASGALTTVSGSPFFVTGQSSYSPLALAGGFDLYSTSATGIAGFTVDANGALTTIAGSPYAGGDMGELALGQTNVSPVSYFLYATNPADPNGTISAFTLDATSGILARVPGTFSAGASTEPTAIVVDSSMSIPLVFVALNATNQVAAFTVDSTGALAAVAGSPFASGAGPASLLLSSSGDHLYVLNGADGTVSVYTVAASGVLTAVTGSPYTVGPQPGGMAITLNNNLYVSLPAANTILGFNTSQSLVGGLDVPATGSPFSAEGAGLITVVEIPPP